MRNAIAIGVLVAALWPALAQPPADPGEQLLEAARHGDLQRVKALVEGGAPLEAKNRYGITPLYYAAWGGHEAVARYLISKGASVNVRDTFYRMSALATAISKKHTGAAQALVEAGAADSATALVPAASGGHAALVAAILEKAKPPEALLRDAAQAAQDNGFPEIVERLRNAGAPAPKQLGVPVAADDLARLQGTYAAPGFGELRFDAEGGQLRMGAMGKSYEMLAYDSTSFASRAEELKGMRFEFVLESGKANALRITGNGMNVVAKRQEAP